MNFLNHFRGYYRLAASDFLSNYATTVAATTIKLWLVNSLLAGVQESSKYLTIYLMLSAISELITGLFSGTVAEHYGVLHTTMSACLLRMGAGIGVIVVIVWSQPSAHTYANLLFWIVSLLVMFTTACDTFYFPAISSFVNRITESKKLTRVLSLLRFSSLMGTLIGPAVAGLAGSTQLYIPILLTETLALLLTVVLIWRISKTTGYRHIYENTSSTLPELFTNWRQGIKTFTANRTYRLLFPFAVVEAVANSGLGFAIIFYFTTQLHDIQSYGWYLSALSAGYAISYLIAPQCSHIFSFARLLTASHILITVCLCSLAVTRIGVIAVFWGFLFAFSQAIISPAFQSIFIQSVDQSLVAQVMSVFISVVAAIGAISYPAWDWMYTVTGNNATVLVICASGLHGFLVLLCAFLYPQLKSIRTA